MKRYLYGTPFPTGAAVKEVPVSAGDPAPFVHREEGGKHVFFCRLEAEDAVYGLGEQVRGMNKRGWVYEGWNTDDPIITEGRTALYGAHNFFLVLGKRPFGAFFDGAGRVRFDVGYTRFDELVVTAEDVSLYLFEGESALAIVREFKELVGRSYVPPKWAFGFIQSRWGYKSEAEIRAVVEGYEKNGIPLDAVCLDIDYMDGYRDFTVDESRFPDLKGLSEELKAKGIYLVPIVDAAVKAERGYSVYDEGLEKGYFCKDEAGEPFLVGVWPGESALPDVLNPEARAWFGSQYEALLSRGIEGFWNDMNEPALFYGKKRLKKVLSAAAAAAGKNLSLDEFNALKGEIYALANNPADYASFYHDAPGGRIAHDKVHNLYGAYMTRAAAEYFAESRPDRRFLLFSRSSYIGMHRCAGIWTGDNCSWWDHLLLNLKMMPALDACGFLYAGADVGGHGGNATEDLLLRWLALGIFFPLLRNHATNGSRPQECYNFPRTDAFARVLSVRYALLPYLYSEYVRCALENDMLFRPLAFEYPSDPRARETEDQLFVGNSLMIAPVCEQNASGRCVYLPARMKMIRMRSGAEYTQKVLEKGTYRIDVPLDEVVFFLREGTVAPLAPPAKNVSSLDETHLSWLKFIDRPTEFALARDDGKTLSSLGTFERIAVRP